MNYIKEYWDKIESGEIIACKKIHKQMENLIEELGKCRTKLYKYAFNEKLGELPIIFIETFCKQSQGKWMGQPLELELWEKAILQATYGFVNRLTGFRRYKEVNIIVARKNGKTTLLAGIAAYMFLGDGEGGSKVYCCANKKDQAKLLFKECKRMIGQSPVLDKMVKPTRESLESKEITRLYAEFMPLASDSNTLDGLNIHCGILDEFHAYKDRNLYDVLKQGTSARDQPIIFQISTNGMVREGIFDEMYDYGEKVINGLVEDEELLYFCYELDSPDEINDERMWIKANPNLGVTKSYDYLRGQVKQGKAKPGYMATVLTKDFNIPTASKEAWLDLKYLKYKRTYTMEELKDQYAIGGADLSSTMDLTCATLLLVKKDDPTMKYVIQKYWMPHDKLEEKIAMDKVPYDLWHKQGWIDTCDGNIVNYSDCTNWFKQMRDEFQILPYWLGYDNWMSGYWIQDMQNEGFKNMVAVIQGPKSFSHPMDVLQADLESDRINYNNNPVLRWCLSNVVVKKDAGGNKAPDKVKSKNRIDGAVSLLDAYYVLTEKFSDYSNLQEL